MARLHPSLPLELARERDIIREIALGYGLDFFEVIFEMVDFQQMNEIAAYMGFPTRYPHWRWGMEYERMRHSYTYGLHKIYEMVINNDPCYAYLLESNELIDQKIVMAHVMGHSDCFKNNLWFSKSNRKMMDEMANHATRVWRIIERIGMEEVEEFIDVCLSLENLIDRHDPYRDSASPLAPDEGDVEVDLRRSTAPKLHVGRSYMDPFINPPDALRAEAEQRLAELRARTVRFPEEPQRDVLLFLLENAPLERWQRDILDIVRKEAYYFAPQGMTKILNEGWACLHGDSRLFTEGGLLPIGEVVQRRLRTVGDGTAPRRLYDWMRFEARPTLRIRTKRGFEVEGSLTHRLLCPDGSWRRLDNLQLGDRLRLAGGGNLWPKEYVPLAWPAPPPPRAVAPGGDGTGRATMTLVRREQPATRRPARLDEAVAAFLGYVVGAGGLGAGGRVALATGEAGVADHFAALAGRLFGLRARKRRATCWHVSLGAAAGETVLALLGITGGGGDGVPEAILRSPKRVVAAFLRAAFDCAGDAGAQGVTLAMSGEAASRLVQLLLLNFGILAARCPEEGGGWRLHVAGDAALAFQGAIGFGVRRKQGALQAYLEGAGRFVRQGWEDEVVAIEPGRAEVYDVSVAETHRYAAEGFINHNSYWHTTIMTQSGVMTDAEVVDYADHHSGTVAMSPQRINPYKIGIELLRDIEDRWNKGRFGKEWDECDDSRARREWDKKLGLGRAKLFEVRRVYNDVGFIDTFFTEDFCNRYQLFTYHYNERTGRFEISSRDFQAIKQKLLFSITNFGQPGIVVQDANYENRGALLLEHLYEGVELKLDEARDTLKNLFALWKRPVYLKSVIDDAPRMLSFDGKEHATKRLK